MANLNWVEHIIHMKHMVWVNSGLCNSSRSEVNEFFAYMRFEMSNIDID